MNNFGSILRGLRKDDRMSQQELADKLGITKSAISMYERGEREPDFKILRAISEFFEVSIDFLLTGK